MYYKIELKEKVEQELLEKIKQEHRELKENIAELYDELIMINRCETYSEGRAFYVANTLTENNIEFTFKTIKG